LLKNALYIALVLISFGCLAAKKKGNTTKAETKKGKTLSPAEELQLKATFYDAVQEKLTGNPDKAISLFNQCLAISPGAAAAHYDLSELYDFQGRFTLAIEHAKRAYEIDPSNPWYIQNLALIYQKNGMLNEAIPLLEKTVESFPDKPEYIFSLAETYRYANKPKKAIEAFNRLEKLVGQNEELTGYKQRIYIEFKMIDEAEKELLALIDKNPENVTYYGMLAELYETVNQNEKALKLYEKIITLDPENGIVHLSLANLYKYTGEKEKSREQEKIAFLSPFVSIDTKVSILLDYYGRPADAEKTAHIFKLLENLEIAHPDDPKTYSVYADFYFKDDLYQAALEKYKKTAELDNSKFVIWQQIMLLETQLQLWDSLIIDSKKAIELFPEQPNFYFFNGLANNQQKNYKDAVKSLTVGKDLVIENRPFLADFYEQLGDAHHNLNEHTKSDEYFSKALKINPNNAFLLNNFSYYLAVRNEKLEEAKKMSEKSLGLLPNQPSFLDTYGYILFRMGSFEESKNYFKQAIDAGGINDGTILEHYGDALFKLEQVDEALKYWKKAKETGSYSEWLDKKITDKKYYE
jgi:tetratricopeptide (TPR) repeat protein